VLIDFPNEVAESNSSARDSAGMNVPIQSMAWGVKWGNLAHPGRSFEISIGYSSDNQNSLLTLILPHETDKRIHLQTGDRRLLVRTLPLERSAKYINSSADCHQWPKGTFVEMRRGFDEQILPRNIVQRKQQSHAPSEWKGISRPVRRYELLNLFQVLELKMNDTAHINPFITTYSWT
jgi:hypothetical protein